MTGQFLTLCPSVAAIIAICDYFIGATEVGGIAVYYVLHIILCLPIFIEGREGHLAYKGSLIFMWIFVQIN